MATHDYVIDNSTGANVRSDINNVLQAILTNNSSSSAPSTTAAYMWWADTTTGILKIRNSANDGWVELLQLDGTLTLEDGSASTPALAFRDDLNTGIFSSAADTFNVATAGVERMELGATTIFNESGADVDFRIEGDTDANLFYVDAGNDRIGISQSSPQSVLDVNGDVTITDKIIHSGDTNTVIRFPANDNISFEAGGTERLRIDNVSGSLVTAKGTTDASLRIDNSTQAASQSCKLDMAPAGSASGVQLIATSDEDFSTGPNRTAHFRIDIRKDGTLSERFRITNTGNVGIGTTTPATALDCTGTIHASTAIGIRTTSPQCNLHVHQGDSGSVFAKFTNSTTTIGSSNGFDIGLDSSEQGFLNVKENKALQFSTNNTERMRIDSSGRVMIGVTSSTVPFQINATATSFGGQNVVGVFGDTTSFASGVGGGIALSGRYNSSSSQVSFGAIRGIKENGTDGNHDGALTFSTRPDQGSLTERMRIDSSGKFGFGVSSLGSAFIEARENSPVAGRLLALGTNGTTTTSAASGLTNTLVLFRVRVEVAPNTTTDLVSGYGGSLVLITILNNGGDNVQQTRVRSHGWNSSIQLFSNSYGSVSPSITFSTGSGILRVNHSHNGNLFFNCAGFIISAPHTG